MRTRGRKKTEDKYTTQLEGFYTPKQLVQMTGKCLKTIYLRLNDPKWGGTIGEFGLAISKENYETIWKQQEILISMRGYAKRHSRGRTKSLRIL